MALVKIFVNSIEIEVESDNNLIDELKKYDVEIPHFCYHKGLGVEGNCRMCLVEIKGAKRPQIACDTPIKEGMEIITDSENVKRLRKLILELEFINHPLDCSVCDQVGECSLQDYYMKFDLAPSRFNCEKVQKDKRLDFGNGVIHDQERCVVCTRCVRFTKEISKTDELGVYKRGDKSRIGVFPDLKVENRYAQNIVDICPVGAMTSEDFRFKRRVYFLKSDKNICHKCSKGCNIFIDYEKKKYDTYEHIYRFKPRENLNINGQFMCDDGRFSYKEENIHQLKKSTFNSNILSSNEIIESTKELLKNSTFLISPNLSLEEMFLIKKLSKEIDSKLFACSNSYIKSGDKDDFLIQEDKSANRASIKILNISEDILEFEKAIKESENIFIFDSKEPLSDSNLMKVMKYKNIINISSKDDELAGEAYINIATKSFTQKSGLLINCDGILQNYEGNIKNENLSILEIVSNFLNISISREDIFDQLKSEYEVFKNIDFNLISENGINLKA